MSTLKKKTLESSHKKDSLKSQNTNTDRKTKKFKRINDPIISNIS